MKLFFNKIFGFVLIPLIYIIINFSLNYYIISSHEIKLNKNISILIVGDSHSQTGINPAQFHNAQNISQKGEPLIITYWKIKEIFKSNTIDTLILSLSHQNISEYSDQSFYEPSWSNDIFKKYYSIFNFNDIKFRVKINYAMFLKSIVKQTGLYPHKQHFNYLGKFIGTKKVNIKNAEATVKRHFFISEKEHNISKLALNSLTKIVNFCSENKIKLVIVSCPVTKKYYKNIPTKFHENFNNLINKFKARIKIIDKSKNNYNDTLFADSDHLNINGSNKFTNEIINDLN